MTRTDPMPERMIRPTITDQEVALLPLADGRADLREEIMSTPVLDHAEPATRTAPEGFGPEDVDLDGFNAPYHASAAVAGAVGCAWLEVYAGGTPVAQKQALAALDGSVDWPLLQAIDADGDFPEVFWMIADDLRGGRSAAALRSSIC